MKRARPFLALGGLALGLVLLSLTQMYGPALGQVGFGPIRDYVAMQTAGQGQRDVSIDMSVAAPRFEIGRTLANGLRMNGAVTGTSPSITATGDTYTNIALIGQGNAPVTFTGIHTTPRKFLTAIRDCWTDNSNMGGGQGTRVAAGDWALNTSTAAQTINIACKLDLTGERTTTSKGIRIDGLKISYLINATALSTHTLTGVYLTTYANNTANSVDSTSIGGSATLATAVQAQPYLTTVTLTNTPWLTTANTAALVEWQAVTAASGGVYRIFGVEMSYSHALY